MYRFPRLLAHLEARRPDGRHAQTRPVSLVVTSALILGLCLGLLPLAGPGCGKTSGAPKILIIGMDGADWQLMDPLVKAGELPNLQSLIRQGASGPLLSLYPIISPVIWTTIATGKGPDKHGILDFTVPDPTSGQPITVSSSMRRSKAFWNILTERGIRVCVVGWWATWPAEAINGVLVSDRLGYHAFIENPEAEEGLVYPADELRKILSLRESVSDVPYSVARRFMDVTAEEYAAAPALDFKDPISHFRHIYRTMATYQAIAKRLLKRERPDVMAVYFEGIDTAGHMFMRYTPPDYPYTTAAQRHKFGQTVTAFYKYQDELVGELLKLIDEQTTVMVVSDHGFLTGRDRPIEDARAVDLATASRWHRPLGVLILKGPQIAPTGDTPAAQNPLRRASVFDITPTILALLGIPSGADMDGRVLTEALTPGFAVPNPIASHEDEAWRAARAAAHAMPSALDEQMQERLRSLGYVGGSEYEETLSLRAKWGLAEYYMFRRELDKAQQQLEDLRKQVPDSPETYYLLGAIHAQRQEYDQARQMFAKSLELAPEKYEALMDLATLERMAGKLDYAAELLERAARTHPYDTRVRINLGMLRKELGQLDRAQELFAEVLRIDPDSHPGHAQMALVLEQLGRPAEAVTHWEAAARLQPNDRTAQEHLRTLRERGYGAAGG